MVKEIDEAIEQLAAIDKGGDLGTVGLTSPLPSSPTPPAGVGEAPALFEIGQ